MSLKKLTIIALAGLGASFATAQTTIPIVPIGPGNAADPVTGTLYGSVAFWYNIGRSEVTNAQYAAFLNAKAATDTNGLYDANMGLSLGGITRTGASGSYSYATVSGRENNPVNYVSFWDACRFANWLHNGQGTGDTETGAYTLTAAGINNNTITRNAGWQWALPSENEWYKAAYHQPVGTGGDVDDYWLYATQSNTLTTAQANYNNVIGNTVPVGSYFPNFYGTFDMSGNVAEWNEAVASNGRRNIRGGSYSAAVANQGSSFRTDATASTSISSLLGFRVVNQSLITISGTLTLNDTIGNSGTETIGWTLSSTVNTYSGSFVRTDFGSSSYTLTVPNVAPSGAYTLKFKGGTFLSKTLNVTITGARLTSRNATLKNGDVDQDGEVGPSDFETVVAEFGGAGTADVDNDGEVGPSDFEIIVANFGIGDE